MSRYLHHFQPDVREPTAVCGAMSGRANSPGAPIDRADWPDRLARMLLEGRPVCEECREAFEEWLDGRPGLAERYGLPVAN